MLWADALEDPNIDLVLSVHAIPLPLPMPLSLPLSLPLLGFVVWCNVVWCVAPQYIYTTVATTRRTDEVHD